MGVDASQPEAAGKSRGLECVFRNCLPRFASPPYSTEDAPAQSNNHHAATSDTCSDREPSWQCGTSAKVHGPFSSPTPPRSDAGTHNTSFTEDEEKMLMGLLGMTIDEATDQKLLSAGSVQRRRAAMGARYSEKLHSRTQRRSRIISRSLFLPTEKKSTDKTPVDSESDDSDDDEQAGDAASESEVPDFIPPYVQSPRPQMPATPRGPPSLCLNAPASCDTGSRGESKSHAIRA